MIRLKAVLKKKGKTQKQLAKDLGITDEALRKRTQNPTLKSIEDIANGLGCEVHELFETSEDYAHFYDKGEWLGIRKKY